MGEPLKDKAKVMPKGTRLQLPNKEVKIARCHIYYFKEEDIKSAVEWLKEEIQRGIDIPCKSHIAYGKGMNDGLKKVLRLIDSAFLDLQDVTKK